MAQPQQNINVGAPGFAGLNTQDSPTEQPIAFAAQADNCVIDKSGRIAVRNGFRQLTTNPDVLGGNGIQTVQNFTMDSGAEFLFACGNGKIFLQNTTTGILTELNLPSDYPTIFDNHWQIVSLNGIAYFAQAKYPPLYFEPAVSTTDLEYITMPLGAAGSGYPNVVAAGYGRLWYADWDIDKHTVYWSELLDGKSWDGGTTGSIDVNEYWPTGYDAITAVYIHNNYLVIFGDSSILLYNLPSGEDATANFGPAFMTLADTIEGIGCIARDTIQVFGTDLWFLDATGVRSLGRTIQEKSIPIGDISYNVRDELQAALLVETPAGIKTVYIPDHAIYAVFLPSNPKTYVFDTRQPLPNGAYRATQWVGVVPNCGNRSTLAESWFGGDYGVYRYIDYLDSQKTTDAGSIVQASIGLTYFTHPQTFDQPANLKMPKQVDAVFIGGQDTNVTLDWAFDYATTYKSLSKAIPGSGNPAFYNEDSLYNGTNTYGEALAINKTRYNIWGQGTNIKFGFRTLVGGAPFSIQEINIQALLGRLL